MPDIAGAVSCQQCGQEIGRYVNQANRVFLHVGTLILRDAYGVCAGCGAEWTWHSSDKQLERLIERLTRPVKLDIP